MQRVLVELVRRPHLRRSAEVHHQDVVGDVADHRQVVRDEHVGGAELLLQVHEQVQYLGLDRHVEGRGRLVRHQHLGLQHHRPGQGDALALAAGEHVRVALVVLRPQADLAHHLLDLFAAFLARERGVDQQRLGQLVADLLSRIERGVGVLEDHLHVAAQLPALVLAGALDLLPGDFQRAGGGFLDQGQGARQGRLAAAGLADHGEGLAGFQFERYAVQRAHLGMALEQAAGDFVVTGQITGGQNGFHQATSFSRFNG
ncbi:Uncharacterised protein [Enterobacter cloacae]|nr:Uncharacterised protein [Enterobacter cloacae]